MVKFFAIFIGGGLGAFLRYLAGSAFSKVSPFFPAGTLFVNILGSFIIGLGYVLFLEKVNAPDEFKLFLTVGFCGGLTTFSTFSLDVWNFFCLGGILQSVLVYVIKRHTFNLRPCSRSFNCKTVLKKSK